MTSSWQVVIMRPKHQAQALSDLVKAHVGIPIVFPTVEIEPIWVSNDQLNAWCKTLCQASMMIVTSANAVWHAPKPLLATLQQHSHVRVFTLGQGTSTALKEHAISPFFTPASGITSESLLTHPLLQEEQVKDKSIFILAGEGGRTVIAQTLAQRQAHVSEALVYCQKLPKASLEEKLNLWQQSGKLCFVATSLNCLQNALTLAGAQQALLKTYPVVVVSSRIADKAREWGFKHIYLSQDASPASVLTALQAIS